jgi:osmotically-inducible protein OsmY
MADRDWGDRGGRGWDRDRDDERFGRSGGFGGSQRGYGSEEEWGSRGYGGSPQRGYNRESTGAQEWNRSWGGGAGSDWNRGGMSGGQAGYYGQGSGEFTGRSSYYGGEQQRWPGSSFGDMGREQTQRGRFTGRGPKGWKRSNERIQEEVNEALARHPEIDASDIEVRVENGEVTLTGVVEDRGQKRLAEDIAEDVFGVDDVNNDLKIRHGFLAGLTGEKADEREVTRGAEREPSSTTGGRSTSQRSRTGRSELSDR